MTTDLNKKELRERLQREGRWDAYVARREQLKAKGVTPSLAWRKAAAEFLPVKEDSGSNQPTSQDEETRKRFIALLAELQMCAVYSPQAREVLEGRPHPERPVAESLVFCPEALKKHRYNETHDLELMVGDLNPVEDDPGKINFRWVVAEEINTEGKIVSAMFYVPFCMLQYEIPSDPPEQSQTKQSENEATEIAETSEKESLAIVH
ncbi:MAG: hypothetical protein ABIH23_30630 [bacterium]